MPNTSIFGIFKSRIFVFLPSSQVMKISKVTDRSRGRPEGSLFNSYYTEVERRVLLLSQDCSTLSLIHNLDEC